MRVTFVLSPVKGAWVSVTATDLGGLEAFAEVQYSAGFFGGLPQIPALLVAAFALAATAVIVRLRVRRDRRGEEVCQRPGGGLPRVPGRHLPRPPPRPP